MTIIFTPLCILKRKTNILIVMFSVLCLLFSCTEAICPETVTDIQTDDWKVMSTGVTETLRGVDFPGNGNIGYICGTNGTILKTIDGGQSFFSLSSGTTEHLYKVKFVTADLGYAIGDNRTLIKTLDGGFTWNPTTLTKIPTYHLRAIHFFNKDTGIVAGHKGQIYRTTDAGASWETIDMGNPNLTVYSMMWLDFNNGFIGCNLGRLYEYKNGFNPSYLKQYAFSYNCAILDFEMLDDSVSLLVVSDMQSPQFKKIESTSDGWNSFTNRYSSNVSDSILFQSIKFLDKARGITVGGGLLKEGAGLILTSGDSGQSWSEKKIPGLPFLYDLSFTSNTVIAVGYKGKIVISE